MHILFSLNFTTFQSMFVCLLLTKSKIFQVYWSLDFVILFVCLSPTGHYYKPVVMKLHQVVEVVSIEKPLILRSKVKFLKSSFFIWLTWKQNNNCIVHHWIGKATILRSKVQKPTQGQSYKIINFNLKNNHFSSDWPELSLRLSILIWMKWTIWYIHGYPRREGGWVCDKENLSKFL